MKLRIPKQNYTNKTKECRSNNPLYYFPYIFFKYASYENLVLHQDNILH